MNTTFPNVPSESMPAVLTPAETFRLLRIGRTSGYAMIRKGELPSIRIGRRVLIPRAQLLRLLEGQPQEPAADQDRQIA